MPLPIRSEVTSVNGWVLGPVPVRLCRMAVPDGLNARLGNDWPKVGVSLGLATKVVALVGSVKNRPSTVVVPTGAIGAVALTQPICAVFDSIRVAPAMALA